MTLILFLTIVLFTASFVYCCKVSVQEAIFGALCAYSTQDLAYAVFVAIFPASSNRGSSGVLGTDVWIELLLMLLIYSLTYIILARGYSYDGHYILASTALNVILFIAFDVMLILGVFAKGEFIHFTNSLFRMIMLYNSLIYMGIMFVMMISKHTLLLRMNMEKAIESKHQKELQYEQFKKNNERTKYMLHNIKYEMSALVNSQNEQNREELVKKMEEIVAVYDLQIHTGYDVLDALLVEKMMYCKQIGVSWTIQADGQAISFIKPVDLYTLLGNIIDNAIENVATVENKNKRFLSLNIHRKEDMVLIRVENFYKGKLVVENGKIKTMKADSEMHGYGLRSIQMITEQYKGYMQISTEEERFIIRVMIPFFSKKL